jgi:hypothetical protein
LLVLLVHILGVSEKADCAGANQHVLEAQLIHVELVDKPRQLVDFWVGRGTKVL